MQLHLECVSCLINQSIRAAREVTQDPMVHEQLVREILHVLADLDFSTPPPAIAQLVYARIREITGVEDPYREVKRSFNQLGLSLLTTLRIKVQETGSPLLAAVRLAIAANIMDLGAKSDLTTDEAATAMGEAMNLPLTGDPESFVCRMKTAREILYLTDNAGEIAFDRLLIETLGPSRITVAVRGRAVVNDATREDAAEVGLTDLVEVIDNGSDAPGTLLSDCSESFRRRFHNADLIIAKGQGNFESLSTEDAEIFFLFKVKCPVLGQHTGLPLHSLALLHSRSGRQNSL